MPDADKAAQITKTHDESVARAKEHLALAQRLNDVGGPDESVTLMSAIVDLLHLVHQLGDYAEDELLDLVKHHYTNDLRGTW